MWHDIGVGIGQRRARKAIVSPLSTSSPGAYAFSDGDQPYNATGVSIIDSTPAWLPADAVFFADFDNNLFYWDGAIKSLSDLADNGDGTYILNLATDIDMSNSSGFVEATDPAIPVVNEGLFDMSNGAAEWWVMGTSGSTGGTRVYDKGTRGFNGSATSSGSNSDFKRYRSCWNYEVGEPIIYTNGYLGTAVNANAVSQGALGRMGIGYRRLTNDLPFSGTIHKICIYETRKTEVELLELARYERSNIGVHWLGDSFLNGGAIRNDFDDLVVARGQYFFTSTDQVGTSSLADQATGFAGKPQYWGQTLVIMDGGLTTDDTSVAALQSIVGNLTHDRWLYVQSNPKEATGTGDRPNWDDEDAAILAFCGPDHYLETNSVMQANGDSSPEDTADIANNIWPRSKRTDDTHPNAAGQSILGRAIYDRIVAEGWLAYTVDLAISDGDLTVAASTSATVTGNSTASLTISGSLADVNTELTSLDVANAAIGSPTITLSMYDPVAGRSVSRTIALTIVGSLP